MAHNEIRFETYEEMLNAFQDFENKGINAWRLVWDDPEDEKSHSGYIVIIE